MEKGMATHSSILAWRTPRAEEPCGLQSTGSQSPDTTEWLTHFVLHMPATRSSSNQLQKGAGPDGSPQQGVSVLTSQHRRRLAVLTAAQHAISKH